MVLRRPVRIILFTVCIWLAGFHIVSAERITDFSVVVDLESDGSFVVTETITYDFQGNSRRGIYRNVKNQHAQPAKRWYQERYITVDLISVRKDGVSEPYREEQYDGMSVRIGDPNVYLTGVHEYEIAYRVDGAIAQFPDTQEFYWNVTGDEWSVPIEFSSLTLNSPPGVLTSASECYVGRLGETKRCRERMVINENTVLFTAGRLSPGEQLTVAQAVTLPVAPRTFESINTVLLVILGVFGWVIALGVYVYRWRTKHKFATSIIPQYEPLPDFRPMFTGILVDGRLDAKDISAGLVYLAQQGFIQIKEVKRPILQIFTDTDYEITLLRPLSEVETEFQKTILELLFVDQPTFASFVSALIHVNGSGKETNEANLVGTTVSLDELKKNQPRLRRNVQKIHKLRKATKEDLVERGYFEQRFSFKTLEFKSLGQVGLWMLGVCAVFFILIQISPIALFVLLISGALFLFGASERRTQKGYEAKAYLYGFKDFLSVTEKERYKFHNAPNKNPQQFMEYLPYAIAFGVEKQWAEVFADIQIYQPEWYQSDSPANTFNPVIFSSALSSFSNSFVSSSGSSGSSGGGSAGGGSGGGGGGSW